MFLFMFLCYREGGCELSVYVFVFIKKKGVSRKMKRTIQQKTCLCFLVKPEPCLSLCDARTDDDMPPAVCTLIITAETINYFSMMAKKERQKIHIFFNWKKSWILVSTSAMLVIQMLMLLWTFYRCLYIWTILCNA